MRVKSFATIVLGAVVALAALGCNTTPTQDGALIGGMLGSGAGAIIGHQSGKAGEGALIGAGAGALAGALIGDQADERGVRYGPQRRNYQAPAQTAPAQSQRGHWETVIVTTQSGETFEERRWVPER